MGLKTTNYEVKRLGITLPEAYAIIKNLRIEGNSAVADFAVQSTRDNSLSLSPLEMVKIYFTVDRNENPYVTAYREAKAQKEVKEWNAETRQISTVTKNAPFYGWEDDIVGVEE